MQLSLFADPVEPPEPDIPRPVNCGEENARRATAEFPEFFPGRRASWTRIMSFFIPGGKPAFENRPVPVSGKVARMTGGAYEYSPRVVVEDEDGTEWWLPPASVTLEVPA